MVSESDLDTADKEGYYPLHRLSAKQRGLFVVVDMRGLLMIQILYLWGRSQGQRSEEH
jgi:hypothetical protein